MWSLGCVLIETFGSMIPWASAKDDHDIGCRVTARGDEKAIVPPEIERVPQVRYRHAFEEMHNVFIVLNLHLTLRAQLCL